MQARGFILTGGLKRFVWSVRLDEHISKPSIDHLDAADSKIPCLLRGQSANMPSHGYQSILTCLRRACPPAPGEKQLLHWHSCWRLEAHLLSTWYMWPSINKGVGGNSDHCRIPGPQACFYVSVFTSVRTFLSSGPFYCCLGAKILPGSCFKTTWLQNAAPLVL